MRYPTSPQNEYYWKNNNGAPGIYNNELSKINGEWSGYWQRYETYEQKQAKIASGRSIYYVFVAGIVGIPALGVAGTGVSAYIGNGFSFASRGTYIRPFLMDG